MPPVALVSAPAYHWDTDLPVLVEAFSRLGQVAEVADWDDPAVDWSRFACAWLRSPWDYHEDLDAFLAWLDRAHAACGVVHPPTVVRWNVRKHYLRALGVPTVPTAWALAGEPFDFAAATAGWERVLIKPAVSAGAIGLVVDATAADVAALHAAGHDVLVQPVLPSVMEEGELSVLLCEGRFTHCVRKRPAAGDLRVQEEWGGTTTLEPDPPAGAMALAEAALAAVPAATVYARVDLVRDLDGALCVIEVEVVEPSLFLPEAGPAVAERYARAVLAASGAAG